MDAGYSKLVDRGVVVKVFRGSPTRDIVRLPVGSPGAMCRVYVMRRGVYSR